MKNSIIKIIAVLFVVMITAAFAGCNNDQTEESSFILTESEEVINSDPLVGKWQSEKLSNYVYTFNDDGTGQYDMAGKVLKLTYSTDEGKITLNFLEEGYTPVTLNYILDGDSLNIKDSFGKDTFYVRVKK